MATHFCGECKATLTGSDLGYDGQPAIITSGDHYWCGACWRADLDRRRTEQEENKGSGATPVADPVLEAVTVARLRPPLPEPKRSLLIALDAEAKGDPETWQSFDGLLAELAAMRPGSR